MSFLVNLFRSKYVTPERVPTDIVIPLHEYDDTKTLRALCLDFSMRFDDVLNVEKLVTALERLLEKPGWRKLGARLRLNSEDKLEYHIPIEYTKARPAVNFTHVSHDISISSHAEASQLLRPSGSIEVSQDLQKFRSLLLPANNTKELADWIYTDRPQLQLHIVSFTDATLVTLSWIHTLLDASSKQQVFSAWIAMLEGREDDVPDFYGYDIDPLARLGAPTDSTNQKGEEVEEEVEKEEEEEEEEYVLKDQTITGWKTFVFVFNYIYELFFYPKESTHIICIPAPFFQSLKQSALDDLKSAHPATIVMDTSTPQNPKPFLSDGDIVTAWWTRLLISSQPWAPSANPTKTIQIMNIFSFRDLVTNTQPKLLPPATTASYIGNTTTPIVSFFPLHDLLTLPLGTIAARIRLDLVTQTTRAQVNASQRLAKAAIKKTGHAPLYGEADMVCCAVSNWTKSRHFDIDFGAAVVVGDGVLREYARGKPSYLQVDGTTKGFSVRNSGPCLGRDLQGNWWVGGCLRDAAWDNVVKAVEGMK